MTEKVVYGDILKLADAGFILHQVNCQGFMGAGVAAQIAGKFPDVYRQYRDMCAPYKDKTHSLLGRVQIVQTENPDPLAPPLYIVNLFGQDTVGTWKQQTDYTALSISLERFRHAVEDMDLEHLPVYYPRIGAGMGGGDWGIIKPLIDQHLDGLNRTLVEWVPKL